MKIKSAWFCLLYKIAATAQHSVHGIAQSLFTNFGIFVEQIPSKQLLILIVILNNERRFPIDARFQVPRTYRAKWVTS